MKEPLWMKFGKRGFLDALCRGSSSSLSFLRSPRAGVKERGRRRLPAVHSWERGRVAANWGLGLVFFVVASAFCFLCNQALVELGILKNLLCYFYVLNRFLQLLFGWRISPGFCSLCMLCGPSPFSTVVPLLCVCVRVLFFSGCCFFGRLHASITELLVLLPSFCCCTRRSFVLAESGWLMTDVCHRCPWLLQTNSIDAFFRCNWCGALRKRCFAVKVKKSRCGDGTVTVVVSLNSFASRCYCFVSRIVSDHLVEVVRFSSLFSLAVGLWWMRFMDVWHSVVWLCCVNFVSVPRALQAVRFPIEKLVVGMVMDVVLWDAAAAVGVSVVLVSAFAIFVVSLSS